MNLFKKTEAVAIDGPAGSGKSTVSRLVAAKLGYVYIDTGAMYRALTLKAMNEGVDLSKESDLISLSKKIDLRLEPSSDPKSTIRVFLDGQDVSEDIRTLEVTVNVKHVAKVPEVRANLVKLQRRMARRSGGAVMEGRDIGTVVLKDAKHKFYVDATFDERVRRRLEELKAKGKPARKEDVAADLKARDHSDKTRDVGPLKQADDAVFIDTTDLTIDEVVHKITDLIRK